MPQQRRNVASEEKNPFRSGERDMVCEQFAKPGRADSGPVRRGRIVVQDMSVDTPPRCQPKQAIRDLGSLAAQVRRLRKSMSIALICEELDLPRDTVLMLTRYS